MSVSGAHMYCGDYLYSGHTCVILLLHMMIIKELPTVVPDYETVEPSVTLLDDPEGTETEWKKKMKNVMCSFKFLLVFQRWVRGGRNL